MKITAVRVETLGHDVGIELCAEPRERVSTVLVPPAPGLGVTLDEDAVAGQRAARRW